MSFSGWSLRHLHSNKSNHLEQNLLVSFSGWSLRHVHAVLLIEYNDITKGSVFHAKFFWLGIYEENGLLTKIRNGLLIYKMGTNEVFHTIHITKKWQEKSSPWLAFPLPIFWYSLSFSMVFSISEAFARTFFSPPPSPKIYHSEPVYYIPPERYR